MINKVGIPNTPSLYANQKAKSPVFKGVLILKPITKDDIFESGAAGVLEDLVHRGCSQFTDKDKNTRLFVPKYIHSIAVEYFTKENMLIDHKPEATIDDYKQMQK